MSRLLTIPVEQIRRRPDARPLNDDTVGALEASIAELGLINPIRVRPAGNDVYEIIAGSHRFAACDLLGHREITALVVDADDLHAELAMIDENLCRAELSPGDRATQTARRKVIYEELHPQTRHGAIGNGREMSRQVGDSTSPNENKALSRFTTETAAATGKSERAVQRDAERGAKVVPEAINLIRGTTLDTGAYLDRLKRMSPEAQVNTARQDLQKPSAPQPGGIAGRIIPKPEPTYDELRSAVLFLSDLTATDYLRLCPPQKRAAMCQKLAHLEQVFVQVREGVSS
jgi:uncharacterized ParB-like nuclease family protein